MAAVVAIHKHVEAVTNFEPYPEFDSDAEIEEGSEEIFVDAHFA